MPKLETTKEERDSRVAVALWKLRPVPRAPEDHCPVPVGDWGDEELYLALCRDVDTLVALLRRAAQGEEPQIRAYHDPLCGECLGCQARAVLG